MVAAAPGPAPAPAPQATELVALEQRLAALEEQNRQKDAQVGGFDKQAHRGRSSVHVALAQGMRPGPQHALARMQTAH